MKCLLSLNCGSVVNFFEYFSTQNINVKQSIYKSLDWWKEVGIKENYIEKNIKLLFIEVFKNFL
ncbi:hypothetical protein H311_02052 [Anncaliia algerae PRA109]|nr:hypothetical protein H311_02052 [Anncaliia algerae PRA109]